MPWWHNLLVDIAYGPELFCSLMDGLMKPRYPDHDVQQEQAD